MANNKGKVSVKVTPKKKAVKPQLSSNNGGILTAKVRASVKKRNSR